MKMTGKELEAVKKRLLQGMYEFRKYSDGAYHVWDVWKVNRILSRYHRRMVSCAKAADDEYKEIVKEAVLALNALNESCEFSLIETEQREDICEYMIQTAYMLGFIQDEHEDITGEWRDW